MDGYLYPADYLDELPELKKSLANNKRQLVKNRFLSKLSYPCMILSFILFFILINVFAYVFDSINGTLALICAAIVVYLCYMSQKKRMWIHRFLYEHLKRDIQSIENEIVDLDRFISFVEAGEPVHRSFFMVSTHSSSDSLFSR